jgi:hypothetical protein
MSDATLTNWAFGNHFNEPERFHEIALHEARIATEHRFAPAVRPAREPLMTRIRVALGFAPRVESCDCAVAA